MMSAEMKLVTAAVVLSFCISFSLAVNCPNPAKEGSWYTLTKTAWVSVDAAGEWKWKIEISGRIIPVQQCLTSTETCSGQRGFSGTIRRLSNGQYESTLTINNVIRSIHETTVKWDTGITDQSCDLVVYTLNTPICEEIKLKSSGTGSPPVMSVYWKCSNPGANPKVKCLMAYKKTTDSVYIQTASNSVTETSDTECALDLNVNTLPPADYKFKVTMYPDLSFASPQSYGLSLESSVISLTLPPPSCDPPSLTNNNVFITCTSDGSSYSDTGCKVKRIKDTQSNSFVYIRGTATATCSGNPATCSVQCTASQNVNQFLEGSYTFEGMIKPKGQDSYSTGPPSSPLNLTLPVASVSECPSGSKVIDGYIKAETDASCKCSLPDRGYPAGVASWWSSKGTELATENNGFAVLPLSYNKNDVGTAYTCRGKSAIGYKDASPAYTPKYAYGPTDVLMRQFGSNPFNWSSKSDTFTATCDVTTSSFNPGVTVSLEGIASSPLIPYEQGTYTVQEFTVTPEKGGNFTLTCVARNTKFPELTATKDRVVVIQDKPAITAYTANSKTDKLTVNAGETVGFACTAEGNPPPMLSVRGEKSSLSLEPASPAPTSAYFKSAIGEKKMRCVDTGTYTCAAKNNQGETSGSIQVLVRCPPELPESNNNKKEYRPTNGTGVEVIVDVIGYPLPDKFTLRKDGQDVKRAKREANSLLTYKATFVKKTESEGFAVLRMYDLYSQDSGQYMLTIGNNIGSFDYSFNVTIVPESRDNKKDSCTSNDNSILIIAIVCSLCGGFLIGATTVCVYKRTAAKNNEKEAKNSSKKQPPGPHRNLDADGYLLPMGNVRVPMENDDTSNRHTSSSAARNRDSYLSVILQPASPNLQTNNEPESDINVYDSTDNVSVQNSPESIPTAVAEPNVADLPTRNQIADDVNVYDSTDNVSAQISHAPSTTPGYLTAVAGPNAADLPTRNQIADDVNVYDRTSSPTHEEHQGSFYSSIDEQQNTNQTKNLIAEQDTASRNVKSNCYENFASKQSASLPDEDGLYVVSDVNDVEPCASKELPDHYLNSNQCFTIDDPTSDPNSNSDVVTDDADGSVPMQTFRRPRQSYANVI